jgi:hypothetical protein
LSIHLYTCICMYVYVCICMYVCMYVYTYIYIYIHTYICVYINIYTYIHTYIHTYMHTCMHTYMSSLQYSNEYTMQRSQCRPGNAAKPVVYACMCPTYVGTYTHTQQQQSSQGKWLDACMVGALKALEQLGHLRHWSS